MPARRSPSRRLPSRRLAARHTDTPAGVPVLKLSTPDDVLAAVPYLLGFHPQQSLVVLGLAGPRNRLGVTMRMDLDGMAAGEMAQRVVRALQEDGDTQAILLVYDPPGPTSGTPSSGLRPGEDVLTTVRAGLRRADIRLREALRVADGRWWSYLCDDVACCPPDGSPIRTPDMPDGPSLVAATAVGAGMGALPDRAALAQALEPPAPWTHEATRQALDRIGAELAGRSLADPGALATELLAQIEALIGRFADRPATLSDDDVARVALGLHLLTVRDTVITWSTRDDGRALQELLIEVVRRTGAPEHVPAATVLAWCAYLHGRGALASVALELVGRSEPDYSLACLVDSMLQHGIHPDRLREVTLATAEDLRRRAEEDAPATAGPSDPDSSHSGPADATRTGANPTATADDADQACG